MPGAELDSAFNMQQVWQRIKGGLAFGWQYLGTLAAGSMLVGALGMGVYHSWMGDTEPPMLFYAGVFNSSAAEPPRGIISLGEGHTPPPLPHVQLHCTAGGQVQRMLHVDATGKKACLPGSSVAEQRLMYNAEGRLYRKENYGVDGQPVADASGVSVRQFEYDSAGRVVCTRLLDAAGHPISPRMPGYAVRTVRYDTQGRPLLVQHFDAEGHLMPDAEGEESVEYLYDDARRLVTRTNRVRGNVADNAHGVAVARMEAAADGHSVLYAWKNAAGEPVVHPVVEAPAVQESQGLAPGILQQRLCGMDGSLYLEGRPMVEHLVRENAQGLPEWECYNAADGLPACNDARGFAERVCQYASDGSLSRELRWDARGNPMPEYERRFIHGTSGARYRLSLHTDGSTAVLPQDAEAPF